MGTATSADYPNRLAGCNVVNSNFKNGPSGLPIYINVNCFALPVSAPAIASQCKPFGSPTTPIAGTCSNLMGNAGRNTVIGPGTVNLDFSLIKNNHVRKISEGFNVQFRAEFFNILNRANFITPVTNATLFNPDGTRVANAGLLDSTLPARQIQFGLKVIW